MHSTEARSPFAVRLAQRWRTSGSLLCVGLDPDPQRLPEHLAGRPDAIFTFCQAIVDATHDLVCAFKPQIAYFAAARAEGALEDLMAYIRTRYPDIPVVLDAKRGDIGATAAFYAREAFERYQADAVTLSPYLGFDSIEPFLAWRDRGVFILCRTSNPGGSDLQFLESSGRPVYEIVAELVAKRWNTGGQCGLVVGATFPHELARVRALVGDLPLLVPGIGAQGGDIEATMRAGQTAAGGMLVNSSRAILYADRGPSFAQAARAAAAATRDALNRFRRVAEAAS